MGRTIPAVVVLGGAVVASAASLMLAAPAAAGCEVQAFARYCDGPPRPDGTWDRCQTAFGQGYPGINGYVPTTSRCYPINPAEPWPMFPLGQPQYHVYP